ncbi:MAG: hypothetical protein VX641_06695 [Planctomycetota bacterium]|nr:hypothetical protein [Planctomycetota bacterium]
MHGSTVSIPILLVGVAATLVGCHGPLNDHDGLLEASPPLTALEPAPRGAIRTVDPQGEVVPIDRRSWPIERIVIDQGQVEARPSYGSAEPVVEALDRASMHWPTTSGAIDIRVNAGDEAINASLAPLIAAGNIVIVPVRACLNPPWTVIVLTPSPSGFQLLPPTRTATPGGWVGGTGVEQPP